MATKIKVPSKFVYLHFHCEIDGCANVFVKCPLKVARQFMNDLLFLNEFVELSSLNGGDPEFPLRSVDITICDKIIENKNCSHNCPSCLLKNKKSCDPDFIFDEHNHNRKQTLIQEGNIFYYHQTDLFQSVILYTIFDLIKKIKENVTNSVILDHHNQIIKNTNISKISLEIDGKEVISINTPGLKVIEHHLFTWVEPIEGNDLQWLTVINKLIEIHDIIDQIECNSKILILQTV